MFTFFCPENNFQTKVPFPEGIHSSYYLSLLLPLFLSGSRRSRAVTLSWDQTCHQTGDTVLLRGLGEGGSLHFSWDHSRSCSLIHDILCRDMKDPCHTAHPCRCDMGCHLQDVFLSLETARLEQKFRRANSSFPQHTVWSQQPCRHPKAPVSPVLADPWNFAVVLLHSFLTCLLSSPG